MHNSFPIDVYKTLFEYSQEVERPRKLNEFTSDSELEYHLVTCELGAWIKTRESNWKLFLNEIITKNWRPYHKRCVDLVVRENRLHKLFNNDLDLEVGARVLIYDNSNTAKFNTDIYYVELIERDVDGIKWKKWDPTEVHHSEVTKQQIALEPEEQKLEEKKTLATTDENKFLTLGPIGFVSTETLKKIIKPEQSDEHVVHGYPIYSAHRRASRAIHEVYVKVSEEQADEILYKTDKE